jgi:hypothetical protein
VFNCSISILLAEADAGTAAAEDGQHTDQHMHGAAHQQQQQQDRTVAHLDPSDPAAVSLRVVEADADQVAVVWCDAAELCDHCSSSESADADGACAAAGDGAEGTGICSSSGTHPDSSGKAAAAAAHSKSHRGGSKQCGGGRVRGGRLAMLSWNDSYALQAAHLQSDKAFGGSSRAG